LAKTLKKNTKKIIILGTNKGLDSCPDLREFDCIITFNLQVEYEGIEKGLPIIYFHRYAQSKEVWDSIITKTENWLKIFPTSSIDNGRSILDIFKFDDLSLWWLVFDLLWLEKNGIFETLYYFETFSSLLKKFSPKYVEVIGQFDYPINILLGSFCSKYDFELFLNDFKLKTIDYKIVTKSSNKISYLLQLVWLKLLTFNQRNRNYELAIFSNNSKIVKQGKRTIIQCENYLNGLENFFEDNQERLKFISQNESLQNSASFSEYVKDLITRRKRLQINWLSFYSISLLLQKKILVKRYQKQIFNFERNKNFQSSWIIDGVDVYPLVKSLFRSEFPRLLFLAKLQLIASFAFLKKEKPKVILTTEFLSMKTRSLVYASINKKIKVIATQAGVYPPQPSLIGYFIHSSFDKRLLPELYVWGEFYRRLFEGWGYPKSKITNVGFFIARSGKKLDCGKYVLHIAAANLNRFSYIQTLDEEIFTIKKIRDVLPTNIKLVVKLHPTHPSKIYFDSLKNLENTVIITKEDNFDIYDLIFNAEVIITKFTTAVLDSLSSKKPLILVNFASEVNFMGINDIPLVTNPNELKKILNEILIYKNYPSYDVDKLLSSVGQNAISKIIKELGMAHE